MTKNRKIIISIISFCMAFLLFLDWTPVYAETKQGSLTTLEQQKDLVVMFTFDKEIVDITLIAPSGTRKDKNSEDVEYAAGDLWATYRVKNAEAGEWKGEYDLGTNSEIQYSIIEDSYGLWIQSLTPGAITGDKLGISFQADCETKEINYRYDIYAVGKSNEDSPSKVASGTAKSGEAAQAEADLSGIPSDTYMLRLEVYYDDGEGEIFDSMESEPFDYTNPGTPNTMEDYKISMDLGNHWFDIDWADYAKGDGYRLVVTADKEEIYNQKYESDTKNDNVQFPTDARTLEIKLYYREKEIWSAAKVKTIDLDEPYIKLLNEEITSAGQAVIGYKTTGERELYVKVNEEEGTYRIADTGETSFDLIQGANTIYATAEMDDQITYVIDTKVYYDAVPPEIKLFDDLDGKTFYTDNVTIIGSFSGGNKLLIDGAEVTLEEDGSFQWPVSLAMGENTIELEGTDANGNRSRMVLTLYKATKIAGASGSKQGWMLFLPLIAAGVSSVVLSILAFLFMKRKSRAEQAQKRAAKMAKKQNARQAKKNLGEKKKHSLVPWILAELVFLAGTGLCAWQFVVHYLYANSMEYLELAEKSVAEAVQYLRMETIYGIGAGVFLALFVVCGLVLVLVKKIRRKHESGM